MLNTRANKTIGKKLKLNFNNPMKSNKIQAAGNYFSFIHSSLVRLLQARGGRERGEERTVYIAIQNILESTALAG